MMIAQVNVGDEIFLDIKRLGINGEGIGYYKKQAIFVNDALPKENVLVKITKTFKGYATADLLEIKVPSPNRTTPFCPYFTKCGGCSLQHIDYKAQGELKRELLMESITRYTKLNPRSFEVKPTILMDNPNNYRAKVSLPIKNGIHGTVFGLYAPNSEKFIRIKNCGVQNEQINNIMEEVTKALDKLAITAFDGKSKKGHVRYVVCRSSVYSKEVQVTFILAKELKNIS
jgi:23S rRNA (uracil-5-)-methyltransferase RumA